MTILHVHSCARNLRIAGGFLLFVASIGFAKTASCQNPSQTPQANAGIDRTSTLVPQVEPFDIAAIHRNKLDQSNRSHILYPAGNSHFRVINATTMQIVQWAWDLPASRILGAPGWLTATRFDIEAQSDSTVDAKFRVMTPEAAKARKRKMVQSLLQNRFRLASHLESRTLPIYELEIAKGGPKFSKVDDAPKHVSTSTRAGETTITITSSSRAMDDLAEILYHYTGRVVIDKTGLTGNYSVALHFTSEDELTSAASDSPAPALGSAPIVFTALKEQLGLQLKPGKAPVSILVIEHIDLPTEN